MKFRVNRFRNLLLSGAAGLAVITSVICWTGMNSQEATIEIRASRQGDSIPDGFYVWHHLDANGISFKSITPKNNNLLITFSSIAQSDAAKEVLYRALPRGYVINQQATAPDSLTWLSLLRARNEHVG